MSGHEPDILLVWNGGRERERDIEREREPPDFQKKNRMCRCSILCSLRRTHDILHHQGGRERDRERKTEREEVVPNPTLQGHGEGTLQAYF